jgi:hypothetical protein
MFVYFYFPDGTLLDRLEHQLQFYNKEKFSKYLGQVFGVNFYVILFKAVEFCCLYALCCSGISQVGG